MRLIKNILFLFLMQLSFAGAAQVQIPTNGLVLQHMYNNNLTDLSGNANNGSGATGFGYTFDRFGVPSAAFSAGTRWLNKGYTVPNSTSLQLGNQVSISFWYKHCNPGGWANSIINDSIIYHPTGGFISLLEKKSGVKGFSLSYIFIPNTIDIFRFINDSTPNLSTDDNIFFDANSEDCLDMCKWFHFVYVADGTMNYGYINGVLVSTSVANQPPDFTDANTANLQVCGGPNYWGPFAPSIFDDLLIYNRALSYQEVLGLYGGFEPPANHLSISSVNVQNRVCTDPSSGAIHVTASGMPNAVFSYSIDSGTTWQNSGSFYSLLPGTYTILVKNKCGLRSVTATVTGPNCCDTTLWKGRVLCNSLPGPWLTSDHILQNNKLKIRDSDLTCNTNLQTEFTFTSQRYLCNRPDFDFEVVVKKEIPNNVIPYTASIRLETNDGRQAEVVLVENAASQANNLLRVDNQVVQNIPGLVINPTTDTLIRFSFNNGRLTLLINGQQRASLAYTGNFCSIKKMNFLFNGSGSVSNIGFYNRTNLGLASWQENFLNCSNLNDFPGCTTTSSPSFVAPSCSSNALLLNSGLSAQTGISWTGPNGFTSNQINPIITPASLQNQGVYEVSYNYGFCNMRDTLRLLVQYPPQSFLADTVRFTFCPRQGVDINGTVYYNEGMVADTLTGTGICDSLRIYILRHTPPKVSVQNIEICAGNSYMGYSSSGTYTDTFALANGCDSTRILHLTTVQTQQINLGADTTICTGQELILDAGINGSIRWDDGSQARFRSITRPGTYFVTVATSCSTVSDTIQIKQRDCPPYFPNAFTPNGDGLNDAFGILNPYTITNYYLVIYSRWGQKIFETTDPFRRWDGTYRKNHLPAGSFIWKSNFTYAGSVKTVHGTVLLIR